jgi:hypothetical protein
MSLRKIIFLFVLLQSIFLGCVSVSPKDNTKDILYIIPHHELKTFAHQYNIDLSILFFYGNLNFILTNNQIFLHQQFAIFSKNE